MAKTVTVKIPDDIEFRVIGNSFGLLIASAGLLAGDMVRNRSFDYWFADIVPLLIVFLMLFRLYRNFLTTMMAYHDAPDHPQSPLGTATPVRNEPVIVGRIAAKPAFSPEQVVEQVAKRIEAQKAETLKKNKPVS